MNKLVEKWRPVLDVGDPVHNEEHAAEVLENLQVNLETGDIPTKCIIIIPMARRLLEKDITIEFDPDIESENPIFMKYEDLEHAYAVCVDAEMVDVMTQEVSRNVKNGDTLTLGDLKKVIRFNTLYARFDYLVNGESISEHIGSLCGELNSEEWWKIVKDTD